MLCHALWLFLTVCCFLSSGQAWAVPRPEDWTWNVCVLPPEGGWATEQGESIRATLSWLQKRVSDSADGVRGHDLLFVFLPPADESTILKLPLPIDAKTVAVMSFASDITNRALMERLRADKEDLPLLLAGGEDAPFGSRDRSVFALDLFRDYRASAFAAYAAEVLLPETRLGLIGSRFTVDQEREARICLALLSDAGLMPLPFWVDASASDSFQFVAQEVQSYGEGVLIAFAGNMAGKELWRSIRNSELPWQLWQCGRPDDSFLSFPGMLFADQNLLLEDLGGFEGLKRDLWGGWAVKMRNKVAAARAYALGFWLCRALEAMPGTSERLDRAALLTSLGSVRDIPFGEQTLSIDPATRRPRSRKVRMLEVRDRKFVVRAAINVEGLRSH